MTDLSAEFQALANYRPTHKVRFVTAASLFDGHDAAINIMRRILQGMGAEVIHLGHNRSVDEVVTAALQEDAQGIAISSYQGGHVEYFKYMVDLLRQRGGGHVQVFGGGGGVIVPSEIRELHDYGVARIYKVANILQHDVRDTRFERPPDFDLAAWWSAETARFEAGLRPGIAQLRATPLGLKRLAQLGAFAQRAGGHAQHRFANRQHHFHIGAVAHQQAG